MATITDRFSSAMGRAAGALQQLAGTQYHRPFIISGSVQMAVSSTTGLNITSEADCFIKSIQVGVGDDDTTIGGYVIDAYLDRIDLSGYAIYRHLTGTYNPVLGFGGTTKNGWSLPMTTEGFPKGLFFAQGEVMRFSAVNNGSSEQPILGVILECYRVADFRLPNGQPGC